MCDFEDYCCYLLVNCVGVRNTFPNKSVFLKITASTTNVFLRTIVATKCLGMRTTVPNKGVLSRITAPHH